MLIDCDFAELFSAKPDVARTPAPLPEKEESVVVADRRSTKKLLREGDAIN